jgi:hypothetical protein
VVSDDSSACGRAARELAAMRRVGGLIGQVMSTGLPAPQALKDAWA